LVVAVALIAGGSRFLGAKASALLKFGSGSSVSQRYGYWAAALHVAAHHPLLGTGPDTYAVTYARYQSASLAKVLGTSFFVNGAHNIFLSWLANEGIPGFLLILALLVLGLIGGIRAWRRFGTGNGDATPGPATTAETRRILAAGLVAALVAYFVQASFDVEQVATLFTLFLVVGLMGTMNRGIWPLGQLLSFPFRSRDGGPDEDHDVAEEDPNYPTHVAPVGAYGRSGRRAQSDMRRLGTTLVAGTLGVAALGLTFWRTDALWRADHDARVGTQTSVTKSIGLNPWEPSYFETLGEGAASAYAQNPKASDALVLIQDAVSYLSQAAALDGSNSFIQEEYGDALASEGSLQNSAPLLRKALAALHLAQQEDPLNTQLQKPISEATKALADQ
jgi:hypothetical protein